MSYTVGSTSASAHDGSVLPHPDQPSGSGVSLPVSINSTYTTMTQVPAAMTNMAWREVLADSDSVVYRTGPTYLIAAFRSFPAQRLFSSFTPREIPDGSGGANIEFVSKSSSRCLTLEQALEAVGRDRARGEEGGERRDPQKGRGLRPPLVAYDITTKHKYNFITRKFQDYLALKLGFWKARLTLSEGFQRERAC